LTKDANSPYHTSVHVNQPIAQAGSSYPYPVGEQSEVEVIMLEVTTYYLEMKSFDGTMKVK
jgi:hypothetical protein